MIDGREPNYLCLDTRAVALAKRLSDSERLAFFDGVCAVYAAKLAGDDASAFPDSIVGELIRQAADTLIDGFNTYMGRVKANPSGKKRTDNPMGGQWAANDTQSNQDQSNQDQINQDQINQIKVQLMADGYTEPEIESALKRCSGKAVRNLPAYLRQTMDNQRQSNKPLPSQNYGQRDYTGVQAELMEEQQNRIMDFIKQERGEG